MKLFNEAPYLSMVVNNHIKCKSCGKWITPFIDYQYREIAELARHYLNIHRLYDKNGNLVNREQVEDFLKEEGKDSNKVTSWTIDFIHHDSKQIVVVCYHCHQFNIIEKYKDNIWRSICWIKNNYGDHYSVRPGSTGIKPKPYSKYYKLIEKFLKPKWAYGKFDVDLTYLSEKEKYPKQMTAMPGEYVEKLTGIYDLWIIWFMFLLDKAQFLHKTHEDPEESEKKEYETFKEFYFKVDL